MKDEVRKEKMISEIIAKTAFKLDFWAPRRRKEMDHAIAFYHTNYNRSSFILWKNM